MSQETPNEGTIPAPTADAGSDSAPLGASAAPHDKPVELGERLAAVGISREESEGVTSPDANPTTAATTTENVSIPTGAAPPDGEAGDPTLPPSYAESQQDVGTAGAARQGPEGEESMPMDSAAAPLRTTADRASLGVRRPLHYTTPTSNLGGSAAAYEPPRWKPNDELLAMVMSVGFSKNAAEKALFYTGNASADAAVGWILEHPDADLESSLDNEGAGGDLARASAAVEAFDSSDSEEDIRQAINRGDFRPFKMVFVVNQQLGMGGGKVAAQVAHATLGLYRECLSRNLREEVAEWDLGGEMKVVVKGESADHLMQLNDDAKRLNIPCYMVQDAGRTQIAAGSITVVSLFGETSQVDLVTGELGLL